MAAGQGAPVFEITTADGRVVEIPAGFTFNPTDEQLVVQYLRRHAVGDKLPCAVVADANMQLHNPWDLVVPEGTKERFLFARKELKYPGGRRANRAAGEGYWRATGSEAPVYAATAGGGRVLVGMKRSLVFYRGHPPAGDRTEWAMQEYRLAEAGLLPYRIMRRAPACGCAAAAIAKKNDALAAALRDVVARKPLVPVMVNPDPSWTLCRIYKKRARVLRVASQAANANGGEDAHRLLIDFMGQANRESSPTPSCLSVTPPAKNKEGDDCDSGNKVNTSEGN